MRQRTAFVITTKHFTLTYLGLLGRGLAPRQPLINFAHAAHRMRAIRRLLLPMYMYVPRRVVHGLG